MKNDSASDQDQMVSGWEAAVDIAFDGGLGWRWEWGGWWRCMVEGTGRAGGRGPKWNSRDGW